MRDLWFDPATQTIYSNGDWTRIRIFRWLYALPISAWWV